MSIPRNRMNAKEVPPRGKWMYPLRAPQDTQQPAIEGPFMIPGVEIQLDSLHAGKGEHSLQFPHGCAHLTLIQGRPFRCVSINAHHRHQRGGLIHQQRRLPTPYIDTCSAKAKVFGEKGDASLVALQEPQILRFLPGPWHELGHGLHLR